MERYTRYFNEATQTIWYHGSSINNISTFIPQDKDRNFLGTGVYFYSDKTNAKKFGNFIYKVQIPFMKKILTLDYRFNLSQIEGLMTNLELNFDKNILPSGAFKPSWWFYESYNYFNIPFDIKTIKNKLQLYFKIVMSMSGVVVSYPSGGNVLFIFDDFDKIKIKEILNTNR